MKMGTGVATYLASQRKSLATILISPYESMTSVIQKKYWFLPVKAVLKHKFDAEALAGNIKTPLLCIVGTEDKVIKPSHSKTLTEAWGGQTEYYELKGYGHKVYKSEELWNQSNSFLDKFNN